MRAHAKPRPLPVRLAASFSRHPLRTLRRGQGRALDRWGIGLGGVISTLGDAPR